MSSVLELNRLTGGYNRKKPVVREITFSLHPGEMAGLIGLNGAGKSTTMKHILGLLKPHAGTVTIKGKTLEQSSDDYRGTYAYVAETPILYEELTVEEHLRMTAMAYGLSQERYIQRKDRLLGQFHMKTNAHHFPHELSKGMRQKVAIMCAFLVEPELYMIDEPFIGLDPLGIRTLLEELILRKKEGAAILMSSHILSMIEHYCDRFIVLDQGQAIAQGSLAEINEKADLSSDSDLENTFYHLVKDGAK